MPIIPTTAPYDTAEDVLKLARSIANDAEISLAGNLLSDAQPYTFQLLASAYRYLQDELLNRGVTTCLKEVIMAGMTPVATLDPGIPVYIGYTGYFDGVTLNPTPFLPADLMVPLRLWERQSGINQPFIGLEQWFDGLPLYAKGGRQQIWEWKNDALYFIGSTLTEDMRLRYQAYQPDIVDGTSTVNILRAKNALAYLTVAEFAGARGSPIADSLRDKGLECLEQIAARYARQHQHGNIRRQPYGQRGRTSGGGL